MTAKKEERRKPRSVRSLKADRKEPAAKQYPGRKDGDKDGPLGSILSTKMSRRTFLKSGVAGGAIVGASTLALKGASPLQVVTSSTSTTTSQVAVPLNPFAERSVTLNVNGTNYTVSIEPRDMLGNVLREDIGLIGTKRPCNRGECGGCAVLIDGVTHYSDNYPAIRLGNGQKILTVEAGVGAKTPDPVISALQQAWVAQDAGQCAYCAPGMIMAAAGLLKANPTPTVPQIKLALSGNLCRCGAYLAIIAAVQQAASTLQGSGA